MRWMILAALMSAGQAGAADLGTADEAGIVPEIEPTPLEWLRYVRPEEGREVTVPVDGTWVRTIEWKRPVEVRVRTESGEPLSVAEKAAIRELALVCDRGEATAPDDRVVPNGTYVIEYDCTWLQGQEDQ